MVVEAPSQIVTSAPAFAVGGGPFTVTVTVSVAWSQDVVVVRV